MSDAIVLDVRLVQDEPGAAGPADWPATVKERPAGTSPPAAPWLRMTVAEYDAYRAARQSAWDAFAAGLPPRPAPVPAEVTNFQARAVLIQQGLFVAVDTALRARNGVSWQAWEYANVIRRDGALVSDVAVDLGLTEAQIDDLFRAAALIEA